MHPSSKLMCVAYGAMRAQQQRAALSCIPGTKRCLDPHVKSSTSRLIWVLCVWSDKYGFVVCVIRGGSRGYVPGA
jgi:hypothetical protein